MGRRSRHKTRAQQPEPWREQRRERMPRVLVDDRTWREFRDLSGYRPIAQVLGEPVEREVKSARSKQLRAGSLSDAQVLHALERAREQQADLAAIVDRLETLRK